MPEFNCKYGIYYCIIKGYTSVINNKVNVCADPFIYHTFRACMYNKEWKVLPVYDCVKLIFYCSCF